MTSSQDETAIFRVLAMALGAVVFYGAGLLTYRFVERLRIASYSFAATGLAFIPLTGVATYVLNIWAEGRYVWLLTSLVGTAAIVGACALMRNRVMAYLLISFIVSGLVGCYEGSGSAFRLVFRFTHCSCHRSRFGSAFCPECCSKGHPGRSC